MGSVGDVLGDVGEKVEGAEGLEITRRGRAAGRGGPVREGQHPPVARHIEDGALRPGVHAGLAERALRDVLTLSISGGA